MGKNNEVALQAITAIQAEAMPNGWKENRLTMHGVECIIRVHQYVSPMISQDGGKTWVDISQNSAKYGGKDVE